MVPDIFEVTIDAKHVVVFAGEFIHDCIVAEVSDIFAATTRTLFSPKRTRTKRKVHWETLNLISLQESPSRRGLRR